MKLRVLSLLFVALALSACDTMQWPNAGSPIPMVANHPRAAAGAAANTAPRVVTVHDGDNLFTLSKQYGVSSRAIIEANNLTPPYRLTNGMSLKLPAQSAYTVARGDTLYGISRSTNVDVYELARLNNLTPPYKILVGQNLVLPGGDPRGSTVVEQIDRSPVSMPSVSPASRPSVQRVDVAEVAPPSAPAAGSSYSVAPAPVVSGAPPRLATSEIATPSLPPSAERIEPAVAMERPQPIASASVTPPTPVAVSAPAMPAQTPFAQVPTAAASVAAPALDAPPPSQPVTELASLPQASTGPSAPSADVPRIVKPAKASKFMWPVEGKLASEYGPKGDGLHNDGINIIAAKGTPVRAAAAGTVAYAGNEIRGFGNLVLIRHADGWMTAYAHNDRLLVQRGDKVEQGQEISEVGATGNVVSPQLHFEIRRGKRAVDPLDQLGSPQTASR